PEHAQEEHQWGCQACCGYGIVIAVRAIDLREHRLSGGPAQASCFPPHADWIYSMCRIGEHDSGAGEIKICYCPVCWGNEDDNRVEDGALDGNLTSGIRSW